MSTVTDLYRGFGSKFFTDQQIYSQDLNNIEYTKLKTIRDSLAACIKQAGVAIDDLSDSSLKVVYVGTKHFTVNPGTAIDKYGRIIHVPDDITGYALYFDGIDDYITAANHSSLQFGTDDFSIECWINSSSASECFFMSKNHYGGAGKWAFAIYSDGTLQFRADTEATGNLKGATVIGNDNTWHHVVLVKDGRDGYIYLDGEQDAFTANFFDVGADFNDANLLYIGVNGVDFSFYFNGKLDEIKFYKRALIPEEVRSHYNSGYGKYGTVDEPNLVAGWHFDEGSGTTASDFSENTNTFSFGGASVPTWVSGKVGVEDHPTWPVRQNIAHNKLPESLTTYYVNIYYTTQQDIAKTDDEGSLHNTREYNSYRIDCDVSSPSEDSGGICLATFPVNADGNIPGGSGSINDCRPLLLLGMQEATTTAREIFRKEFLADDSTNDYFTEEAWRSGDFLGNPGVYFAKAKTSFRYYGETEVNVHFCVPAASNAGHVRANVANTSGSYNFGAGAGNYSFSFNLDVDLSQDVLYDVTVYLANVNGGETAYISEMVIDVV